MPQDMECPPESRAVIGALRAAGHEAYYVGGCVRDWLLGKAPKDWDIATSAHPEEIEALFAKTIAVGKAFGVMVVLSGGREFEVATFRGESGYSDGRRPDAVSFCGAREDVLRRDFTINALMYDPEQGRVIDYVGGQEDLRAGIIRTVGEPERRFAEDHLRILRAVRFAARTGFAIEEKTFAMLREMAGLVRTVSAERTGKELLGIISAPHAARGMELMLEGNLWQHTIPEVLAMRGMPQPVEFHPEGDVFEHTRLMLGMLGGELPADEFEREVLAWAVLLHDIGKPGTVSVDGRIRFNKHDQTGAELAGEILRRLKRPNRVIEAVCDIIGKHMHFANLGKMRLARLRRFLREPLFPLHLALHRFDCASSHRMLDNHDNALVLWREEMARPLPLEPLINGEDLIGMGYPPGPVFKRILEGLEDARLEGEVETRQEALIWVRNHYRLNNLP